MSNTKPRLLLGLRALLGFALDPIPPAPSLIRSLRGFVLTPSFILSVGLWAPTPGIEFSFGAICGDDSPVNYGEHLFLETARALRYFLDANVMVPSKALEEKLAEGDVEDVTGTITLMQFLVDMHQTGNLNEAEKLAIRAFGFDVAKDGLPVEERGRDDEDNEEYEKYLKWLQKECRMSTWRGNAP